MSGGRPNRQRFWHGLRASSVALVAFFLLSVNSLYGQNDALFINNSGNVGIGTNTPGFPLTFPDTLGDKISLYGQSGNTYGFGIKTNELQIHTIAKEDRIVFGYGSSNSFTETMRIQGDGNIGIGTKNLGTKLDVNGTLNVTSNLTVKGTGESSFAGTLKATSIETKSGVSLELLIPIGTIVAYGGDTKDPGVVAQLKSQGWLPCDGQSYSREGEYQKLAKLFGNSFGVSGSAFRVPDLRGRFLRGADQGTGRDPDASSRGAENGGNAGDRVGSVQDDQFKSHTHGYRDVRYVGAGNGNMSGTHWNVLDGQTVAAGGSETRPKNAYVNWIIKAK